MIFTHDGILYSIIIYVAKHKQQCMLCAMLALEQAATLYCVLSHERQEIAMVAPQLSYAVVGALKGCF